MTLVAIELDEEVWAHVVAGLVWATRIPDAIEGLPASGLDPGERDQYAAAGRAVAEACPKGSAAWFGAALLPR